MTDRTKSLERTLNQDEFNAFARLSGDDNPIHVDPEFAERTRFGRPVAHGAFLFAILRGMLDELAPGARQVRQEMKFPAPTYAGEAMRFSVVLEPDRNRKTSARMEVTRIADGVVTCEASTDLEFDERT